MHQNEESGRAGCGDGLTWLGDEGTTRAQFLRRMGATGLAVSSLSALAACSSGEEASSAEGQITWMVRSGGGAGELPWVDRTIAAFEKANPGARVKKLVVPVDNFDQKITSLAAAGTPPDVFTQWGNTGIGDYSSRGLVMPLDDLIEESGWDLSTIPAHLRDAYRFDGKLYGVPMYSLGVHVFYNKKLFDEAGVEVPPTSWKDDSWTWDEMVRRAKLLTKNYGAGDAQYGLVVRLPVLYPGVTTLFGGDIISPEDLKAGKMTGIDLTSPEVLEGLQAEADLYNVHKVSPTPSVAESLATAGDILGTGRVAMFITGDWEFAIREIKGLEWGVGALPLAERRTHATFSDPTAITAKAKNPDLAFELVTFVTTGPGQKLMGPVLTWPPADERYLDGWYELLEEDVPLAAVKETYTESLETGVEQYPTRLAGFGRVMSTFDQMITPLWEGKQSAAQLMPGIEDKLNEIIREEQ